LLFKSVSLFAFTSISQYHAFLAETPGGCSVAVRYYLSQIAKHKHLNAFLEVFTEEALERAQHLDKERATGKPIQKLHGVIIALKDVICYENHKVSASSHILENFTCVYNATAVQKLLDEGAIIIGRNNCDEFAMGSSNENSAYGAVLNSIDNTRVPGGSSGGSAVSVQADLCMVGLGSDTGGSVRQPADFCGIVGLKPSYGRVSRYGLIAYASSFDQIGIFAKNISDAALVLGVISGKDEYDSTVTDDVFLYEKATLDDKMYRIGYFPAAFNHPSLDAEIAEKQKNFLSNLQDNGIDVVPIDFDFIDYIVPAYYILTTAEASSNLSRYDGIKYGASAHEKEIEEQINLTRSNFFGKEVKRRIMLGTFVLSEGYYDAYVSQAQKVRRLLLNKVNNVFKEVDAIISPVSPTTAFTFGEKTNDPIEMFLADIYTVFANLVGIPGVSIPLFKHSNGMPFGLQLMASHLNELVLLALAEKISVINEAL
jgi:aspartyl-tRNA(Asn)/glutamyl-tRNA(Gln) amidotransferase subunit A